MQSSMRRGITLIEVVAAMALMGTLLTVIVLSSSQHLRQMKLAEQKRQSVEMLNHFLATWSLSNFDAGEISDAVARSGLSASGRYGDFDAGGAAASSPGYHVDLKRMRASEFGIGSVVRWTVSVAKLSGPQVETAWAEVIVPQ